MVHFISARLLVVAVTTWWTLSISSGIGLVNAEPQHLRSTRYGEQDQREAKQQRNLNTNNKAAAAAPYYHTISTDTLGTPNPDAAIGNPLKGLVENPVYTNPPYPPDLPVAVEFHYLGKYIYNKAGNKAMGPFMEYHEPCLQISL